MITLGVLLYGARRDRKYCFLCYYITDFSLRRLLWSCKSALFRIQFPRWVRCWQRFHLWACIRLCGNGSIECIIICNPGECPNGLESPCMVPESGTYYEDSMSVACCYASLLDVYQVLCQYRDCGSWIALNQIIHELQDISDPQWFYWYIHAQRSLSRHRNLTAWNKSCIDAKLPFLLYRWK